MAINPNFINELKHLINRYSQESGSNTPDFILAEYLSNCLEAFNKSIIILILSFLKIFF